MQSEYGRAEYHEVEYAGTCEECGEPLIVRSQDNGTETPDTIGHCPICGIYYG